MYQFKKAKACHARNTAGEWMLKDAIYVLKYPVSRRESNYAGIL
jgi:hypothetical protein